MDLMKNWDDIKNQINSLSDDEKKEIEMFADIVGRVVERRHAIGMSQRDLAEKSGIKQSAIARLEAMRTVPQLDTLSKILKPLGLRLIVISDEDVELVHQH